MRMVVSPICSVLASISRSIALESLCKSSVIVEGPVKVEDLGEKLVSLAGCGIYGGLIRASTYAVVARRPRQARLSKWQNLCNRVAS